MCIQLSNNCRGELDVADKSKTDMLLKHTYGKKMFEQYMEILKDLSLWETSTTCYAHDRDGKPINPKTKPKSFGATESTQVIPHMVVVHCICPTDYSQ